MTANRPIRVCFVAPKAYPLFNPGAGEVIGGAEVDVYFLATELALDRGFEVRVVVGDYGQRATEEHGAVRVLRGPDLRQSALRSAAGLWRTFRKADADIYFIKTLSPGVPLLAAFCACHSRAFVYRGSSSPHYDRAYRRSHPVMGRAFAWALRRARCVFVQSREAADALLADPRIRAVQVVPNGHRLPQPVAGPRQFVLWVGRSDRMKGPGRFLDLAKALPEERFVMVCQRATGDRDYASLRARAQALANLEFVDRVPFGQIDAFFEKAKVLVNTSDSEGFANTFIQAGAHGVALLSLNANPDGFLAEHHCGLCAQGSFDRMVDGLRSLLAEGRFVEIGRNGRAYVEQHHDIRTLVDQYKQAFRGMV